MDNDYPGVITRFLRNDERLILSEEKEMPLVLEAQTNHSSEFLQEFLAAHAINLIDDLANYGAILLRGFDIKTDLQFEQTILSIPEFHGISEAFMSENGRDHVKGHDYVLPTNSVYKTGGTLYIGGFHTENYYSADVPSYLCFCCFEPSKIGGETGIINTAKIYRDFNEDLKTRLEKSTYFVSKWLVSEVAKRYQIPAEKVEEICDQVGLPRIGKDRDRFILMYKPSVFKHPLTKENALSINLFELPGLNDPLRQCFMADYQGNRWFWHRFFWSLPSSLFNSIEQVAVMAIAFFNSPKKSYQVICNKLARFKADKKSHQQGLPLIQKKVGACFDEQEVKLLAQSMRKYYSSCLWRQGDILLIDNKKVMHAGMPGSGPRLIRAMICNPLAMDYSENGPGIIDCIERTQASIGTYVTSRAAC